MSYILHPYKGVCFTPEKSHDKSIVYSDGLDQFDWPAVLPQIEILPPSADTEAEEPKKKGKDARREKREARKQKKATKSAEAHSKLARAGLASPSSSDVEETNPYVAKRQISDIYRQISRAAKSEEDIKLFKFESIDFYRSDVQYLMPGEWLNDNNISLIYEMIITYFLKENDFGFHIQLLFPSLIQLFLHFPVEDELQGILPMKDLAKSKLVFLPFNCIDEDDYVDLEDANNGDHWALCVLSIPERKLFVYDSMAFDEEDDRLIFKLAHRLEKALFKPREKITVVKMKCDQQNNFDDCGVFLIMFSCYLIASILSGEPTDLSLSNVKFNPLVCRLKIMEFAYKYTMSQGKGDVS